MEIEDDIPSMNDVIYAGDATYNILTFAWYLIDVCQYKCSYCSSVNFNVNTFTQQLNLKDVWKNVIKRLSLNKIAMPFTVELLGGEPTIHPDIFEIVSHLSAIENCARIDLITNLAKPLSYFKKFDIPANHKLMIEASYHPEYCNENYILKVLALSKCQYIKIFPNINLPDDAKYWEQTKRVIDIFKSNGIRPSLNFLQEVPPEGNNAGWKPNYTADFWQIFKSYLFVDDTYNDAVQYDATTLLQERSTNTFSNIKYVTTNNTEYHLSETAINKYHLRSFKGWTCKPLKYFITIKGEMINHCTNEVIPIHKTNKLNLTKCVICPVDTCGNCDVKFLYVKHK